MEKSSVNGSMKQARKCSDTSKQESHFQLEQFYQFEQRKQILSQWQQELEFQSNKYLENVASFYCICRETEREFEKIRQRLETEKRQWMDFRNTLNQLLAIVENQLRIENVVSTASNSPINQNQACCIYRLQTISAKLEDKLKSTDEIENKSQDLIKQIQTFAEREQKLNVLADKLKILTSEIETALNYSYNTNLNPSYPSSISLSLLDVELLELSNDSKLESSEIGEIEIECESEGNDSYISNCNCDSKKNYHSYLEQSKTELLEYCKYRTKYIMTEKRAEEGEIDLNSHFRRNYFHFSKSDCTLLNELLRVVECELIKFWVIDDKARSNIVCRSISTQTEIETETETKTEINASTLPSLNIELITNSNSVPKFIRPGIEGSSLPLKNRFIELSKKLKDIPNNSGFTSEHYYLEKLAKILDVCSQKKLELFERSECNKFVSIITTSDLPSSPNSVSAPFIRTTTTTGNKNGEFPTGITSIVGFGYGDSAQQAIQMSINSTHKYIENIESTSRSMSSDCKEFPIAKVNVNLVQEFQTTKKEERNLSLSLPAWNSLDLDPFACGDCMYSNKKINFSDNDNYKNRNMTITQRYNIHK